MQCNLINVAGEFLFTALLATDPLVPSAPFCPVPLVSFKKHINIHSDVHPYVCACVCVCGSGYAWPAYPSYPSVHYATIMQSKACV